MAKHSRTLFHFLNKPTLLSRYHSKKRIIPW